MGVSSAAGVSVQTPTDFDGMAAALQKGGPLAISIDASSMQFDSYASGVYTCRHPKSYADHAVTAVGWGTNTDGSRYWIIKNSWGASWGLKGYIWIAEANCLVQDDSWNAIMC